MLTIVSCKEERSIIKDLHKEFTEVEGTKFCLKY